MSASDPVAEPTAALTGPTRACENCGAALLGEHCHACGQPTKGLVRHFGSILGDFFDTVLNIDSRVLRTLWPLFARPGYLTREYFAGRRVRYVTPVRLYLFLSVVMFFAIQGSINIDNEGSGGLRVNVDGKPAPAQTGHQNNSLDFPINGKLWNPETNPVTFGWLPAPLNKALNHRLAHARDVLKQSNSEKPLLDGLFNVLPQTLFLLMPLFALMLKLAYWFKRRLYMEHLIVALHSHSFIALMLSLIVFLSKLQDWLAPTDGFFNGLLGLGMGLSWLWIPICLLLMQKRVYGQGWPMTLIKYAVLGMSYFVLLGISLAGAMLVGLLTL